MKTDAAKFWYLKKIDMFEHLSEDEMEALGGMTQVQDIPEGEPIYFPGDKADTVYMLKKGRVRLSKTSPEGKTITLAILEEGDIFGELSLAGEETRNTRAETLTSSFMCAASKEQFLNFLDENDDLKFEITKLIGDRRREVESRIGELIFRDSRSRVAYILNDLFQNHTESDEGDQHPEIAFSHEDISDLTGLTRPTTSSILKDFETDGLIELNRKRIRLDDPVKLKQKAEQ